MTITPAERYKREERVGQEEDILEEKKMNGKEVRIRRERESDRH